MSKPARSIFVFGIYLVVTGLILFVIPNALLGLLRLTPTTEPWIRGRGVAVGAQGAIYLAAARQELTGFFQVTVWARGIVLLAFGALVVLHWAPAIVIGFGLIDTAGAVWTRTALRSQMGAA